MTDEETKLIDRLQKENERLQDEYMSLLSEWIQANDRYYDLLEKINNLLKGEEYDN